LLRLWIVASVAWAIGVAIWLMHQGAETAQLFVDIRCNELMNTSEWMQCFREAQGPTEGGTWFLAGLRSGQWLLIVAPPILLLIVGAVVVKTSSWVTRGFSGIEEQQD
jgi:H+/Cl- antiporter ClcA